MKKFKADFLTTALLRYGFHVLVFMLFLLMVELLYLPVQLVLVKLLSVVHYVDSLWLPDYVTAALFMFIVLCYWADYKIVRKNMLKEYTILYLLGMDAVCLLLAMVVMVIFNNLFNARHQLADAAGLNNIPVILVLVFAKNWVYSRVISKKAARDAAII